MTQNKDKDLIPCNALKGPGLEFVLSNFSVLVLIENATSASFLLLPSKIKFNYKIALLKAFLSNY